jgi:hypothetical protein
MGGMNGMEGESAPCGSNRSGDVKRTDGRTRESYSEPPMKSMRLNGPVGLDPLISKDIHVIPYAYAWP